MNEFVVGFFFQDSATLIHVGLLLTFSGREVACVFNNSEVVFGIGNDFKYVGLFDFHECLGFECEFANERFIGGGVNALCGSWFTFEAVVKGTSVCSFAYHFTAGLISFGVGVAIWSPHIRQHNIL